MFRKVAFPCALISGVVLCLLFSTEAQAQVFPRLSNWFQISSPCVTFTDAPLLVYYAGERRSIFNGKDLDGWTNSKGELPGKGWKVEAIYIYKGNTRISFWSLSLRLAKKGIAALSIAPGRPALDVSIRYTTI